MILFWERSNRGRKSSKHALAMASSLPASWRRGDPQSPATASQQPYRLRTLTLVICGAVLVWLVVSHSLVLYLADTSPDAALWLKPSQPEALINLADHALNANASGLAAAVARQRSGDQDAGDSNAPADSSADASAPTSAKDKSPNSEVAANGQATDSEKVNSAFQAFSRHRSIDLATVRAEAASALADNPLDPRALRVLGQAADAAGDDADAWKFMRAAAQLSMHETIAEYWMMRKTTEAGDYKAAIGYADALLRTNLSMGPYVVPILAHFAGTAPSNGLIKTLIDANPPWRKVFFAFLPRSVSDVRTPLDLLLSLKGTSAPPTIEESSGYLNYLIAHKYYNLAYYAWLQFLSPEELKRVGPLYNGNFATVPSGLPFDWDIEQGAGVSVDIVPKPGSDDERALSIDFLYGRVDYHSVNELVLLAPGTYQFHGKYKGELIGPRGLKWRIACANDVRAPIAESPMIGGEAPNWRDVQFTFSVPETNCPAQYVRVDLDARSASEQLVTGSMLFADLNIVRVTDASDSEEPDPEASDSHKSSN